MKTYDWIIRNGRVIDPANQVDGRLDVAIQGGRIAALKEQLDPDLAQQVYDAAGRLVVPGLIDIHVHGYDLFTPLGISVDHYCLGRGVTTAVDAGSAGFSTYAGLKEYFVRRCQTRLLAFLHISCAGLAFAGLGGDDQVPGELLSLALADPEGCAACVNANRDNIVGVKVRLSDSIADGGRNEAEAYRRALQAARAVGLPLMVHHALSTVPMEDCPGLMEAGDIYTHCYHGFPSTIVDTATGRTHAAVRSARERGVVFDIGHGQGSFNWTVGEACAQEGFWPDTISTDLHSGNCEGPAYDMPTVMSRLLHLGMPLSDIIRASTHTPARAIGWQDRIGSLGLGREADVAVLEIEPVEVELEDCQAQMRRINRRIVARAVWRAGRRAELSQPRRWPNPEILEAQSRWWERLAVRDIRVG